MSFSSDNSTVCPHGLVCVFHISSLKWQSKKIANLCLQFFNRRKGKLHYIRPVGRSVGVTINFPSPNCVTHTDSYFILTKSHHIPFSTTLYWPSTTKYQPVPPNTFFNRLEQKKDQNSIRDMNCLLVLVLNDLLSFLTFSSHKDDSPVDYLGLLDQEGRRSRFSEVVDDRFRSFVYVFVLFVLSHWQHF